MLIGEKYEILQSSAGMMIFLKYLLALCALLLVGWSPAFAAAADDMATETSSTSTATSKTHHKKHHSTKTAATDTNSTTAPATDDATAKSGTATTSTKNTKTSTTPASTDASTDSTATTTATTSTSKSHKKKGHGTSTATSTNAPAVDQPVTAFADKNTSPKPAAASSAGASANLGASGTSGIAAAAATAVSGQAVTTTGKGKHRKHGAAVPQPPIVVNPAASTPLAPATTPVATTHVTDPAAGDAPKIETVLPVPRPGAGTTASLPLAMVRTPVPQAKTQFQFNDFTTRKRTQNYPWKNGIVTTVFWIGEGSTPLSAMTNLKSAWDGNWVHNNGGADDQYDMSGYGSGSHASTLNPFYIALPFNDLAYPDKSSRWLPDSWPRGQRRGNKMVSSCQHRWIEIKNRAGRVCFAQWEDVGPIVTDDAEYVFGSSRPSASRGLDVSPAVAKYLGIDSTAYTSWRFVDDEDVLPGMWLRYDEQALLFRAMKEKMQGGGANTRIQQLEEPTPDSDDNDANQRRINSSRG